ncbi:hypothetical protein [Bosea sp. BH3]|uniref:hypothetical protein n=1 Tax=Bosea sp. BH3 TaxID=2871701 RepID=UPI0021CB4DB2|nr:hypothetical protein [Bosea sp. BH3]MCU4179873.1 hypothetical protein [Bosea sp. BH3]
MALRVISAFFCGNRPPITRLMIAKEYTGMPVGFLECWATVLWTLDAIDAVLGRSARHQGFIEFVRKARAEVAKILGLTQSEMKSETMTSTKSKLDDALGVRLRLQGKAAA